MTRREFLPTMGILPFLPGLLTAAPAPNGRPRALIVIWLDGGLSHLDSFDGKPEAPENIRGALTVREAALPGVFMSAHLPRLARLMPKMSVVRSLTSPEGNHDRGSCYMLTGRRPTPVLTYPSMAALLASEGVRVDARIPPYVAIPDAHAYARQGFLPLAHGPFELGGVPGVSGFRARHLTPSPDLSRAIDLLKQVDRLDGGPRSASEAARDQFLEQARYLSLDQNARRLFEVDREPAPLRARYGQKSFGTSLLLARRLIEGGARTVFVRDKGWDHHRDMVQSLTYGFPPKLDALDQGVSALFEDMERRGLLESTLVVLASEFGRTPRLNLAGGRDHWSQASCALLFGCGIRPGVVVGETDAKGEAPISEPVTPADLFATILQAVNADTDRMLHTADGRPIPILESTMRPISRLVA